MRERRHEVIVGSFVILAFIALSVVVFFIGGAYFFRPGYPVYVMYDYVSIIDKGAPVRIAGVRVGQVAGVELKQANATQKTRVKLKLFIMSGVPLKENYIFKIQGTHVLSEPHIEITPEEGESPLLKAGATVEGVDPIPVEYLIERARDITTELSDIIHSFAETVEDGTIRNIVQDWGELAGSLNGIISGNQEEIEVALRNIRLSSDALSITLDQLSRGEGTAGKLLMEDELYEELLGFVHEIKTHPWRLLRKDKKRKFLFF